MAITFLILLILAVFPLPAPAAFDLNFMPDTTNTDKGDRSGWVDGEHLTSCGINGLTILAVSGISRT